ncbi:unnamed protein product [Citrullus colocynthis]|uniref:Uncharacterized protein n=1 Tax=Citrullus colocynthis TaxID=252529 RepID=A0ABP0ZA23_9ROSI
MSSMMNSQGMALATAMAAVSGTVILLSFCIQKSIPIHQFSPPTLRSCILSDTRKKKKKQNQKKRVHFAKDVVDPIGNGDDFRRQHQIAWNNNYSTVSSPPQKPPAATATATDPGMPANRVALYNGILRDRVVHRYTYSC